MTLILVPQQDYILVRKLDRPDTKSGLVLPAPTMGADVRPQFAEVLDMGPGRVSEFGALLPMPDIEQGDVVMIQHAAGCQFERDGESFWMVTPSTIMAKLPKGATLEATLGIDLQTPPLTPLRDLKSL